MTRPLLCAEGVGEGWGGGLLMTCSLPCASGAGEGWGGVLLTKLPNTPAGGYPRCAPYSASFGFAFQ